MDRPVTPARGYTCTKTSMTSSCLLIPRHSKRKDVQQIPQSSGSRANTSTLYRIQVGDQFGDSDQGPHNSKMQYEKIMGYIDRKSAISGLDCAEQNAKTCDIEGKKEGATLHLGGNAVAGKDKGYFIEVR